MKRVYIAAAWSRREEALELAEELEELDVHVQAHWLYERPKRPKPSPDNREKRLCEMSYIDVADIRACDVFVRLSDDLSSPLVSSSLATGARMFEHGLAYALGKVIYIVGGKQMIHDRLPNHIHVRDKEHLKRELCPTTIQ
jgi:nucleoside 2-deoxyribosyltransferase